MVTTLWRLAVASEEQSGQGLAQGRVLHWSGFQPFY